MIEVLPSSVAREIRGAVIDAAGITWIPAYCASCGTHGPYVIDGPQNFAFYLCEPCADKHGEIAGMTMLPDEVHWQMQREEQLAKYGRELTVPELVEIEKDGHHTLTKLARDFARSRT